jgi:hypothetical protein
MPKLGKPPEIESVTQLALRSVLDAEVLRNARARRWAESQRAEVGQQ